MDAWYGQLCADCQLPADVAEGLRDVGFVVMPGPLGGEDIADLAAAYDAAVRHAHPDDVANGSTTVRISDFVNRGPEFDQLYIYEPLLAACCSLLRQPFKLSTLHARSVKPNAPAQALHADFRCQDGWPMVGFIIMVDEFRVENGATRFVPGSHLWPHVPMDVMQDATADYAGQVAACGQAGAMVIYNGSIWHGHTANLTARPRRSIQGAYIRRDAEGAVNQASRIRPATRERIGSVAKYLLDLL